MFHNQSSILNCENNLILIFHYHPINNRVLDLAILSQAKELPTIIPVFLVRMLMDLQTS